MRAERGESRQLQRRCARTRFSPQQHVPNTNHTARNVNNDTHSYVDREAYENVHKTSAAMAAFKEATNGIKVTVTGTSYIESNIGFM